MSCQWRGPKMSPPGHCTVESHKICSVVVKLLKELKRVNSMAWWDMPRYSWSVCHNTRERSWVLAYFSLSPTFKCQLAVIRRRDFFIEWNKSFFISGAELWIILYTWTLRGASRRIETLSQTISRVRTKTPHRHISLSLLFTAQPWDVSKPWKRCSPECASAFSGMWLRLSP